MSVTEGYAFAPEAVEIIAAAFDKSWRFVAADPYFAPCDHDDLQVRLSTFLLQLASAGEEDPVRLANGAIGRLRSQRERLRRR